VVNNWICCGCSFDHSNNREVNRTLIRNVRAIVDKEISVPALVKRTLRCSLKKFLYLFDLGAARTCFKTQKNCHRKVSSGKQAATAAECRQRQGHHNVSSCNMHNIVSCFNLQKAHVRRTALWNSATLDEATKKKVEPLLTAEYMSSDETAIEDSDNESSSDSSEPSTE